MNESDEHVEINTARLIRAGYAPGARPDAAARERLLLRLRVEVRAKAAPAVFPAWVLGLLAGLGCALAAWALARLFGMGARALEDARWLALTMPLCVNLALMPAASLVIIVKRRKHGSI